MAKPERTPARGKDHQPTFFGYHPGSLLDLERLAPAEITALLERARRYKTFPRAADAKALAGRRIALLFYEASTRTRVSFEFAAKSLGATVSMITTAASSIEKGESLIDTGLTLEATGAEAIVMRHPQSGAAHLLARNIRVPVINAGDGMHEHPTQGLLDAMTMLEQHRSLKGLRVTIVGDIQHSRVARSNVQLLTKFGAQVTLCGPEPLLHGHAAQWPGVKIVRELDQALNGADVVMTLRVQKERLAGLKVDLDDYIARYQITPERMQLAKPRAMLMHPGPIIRGLELTAEAADSAQSAIVRQVENGVYMRKAVLERAFTRSRVKGGKR